MWYDFKRIRFELWKGTLMLDTLTTAVFGSARAALLVAALAGTVTLGACAQANVGGYEDSGSEGSSSY